MKSSSILEGASWGDEQRIGKGMQKSVHTNKWQTELLSNARAERMYALQWAKQNNNDRQYP